MKARIAKKILKYKDTLNYGEHQIKKAESVVKSTEKKKAKREAAAKA